MIVFFCTACSIFAKSSAAVPFIREGHSDWSNIMRHAERHNKSPIHLSAVSDALAFKHICDGKKLSIKQSLSKTYAEQVARNRAALVSIVKIICLCGKQGIALRGKTDSRSNFMALLELRSEHDTVLREHLKLASKNSQYISHRIQNEIISIIGSQIRETILTPCREAKYFSVIVDKTTDISVKEQVALVVLCVTSDGSRHEEFVTFEETADTTGETLYKLICNKLEDCGLDKNKVVGLGFDGASNMSGKIKGVQARFVNDVPTVEYVHCRAHCLNLAITHTCKETSVRNLYSVVGEIVKFINASAKRLHIYTSQNEDADRLKKFCATRWGCHEETLGVFLNNIENIIDTLHFIRENDTDPSTAAKAGAFFMSIHCFQFLTTLVIVHHYLNLTKPLSMALQSKTNNLIKATQECKELVEMLKSKRSDGSSFEHLYRKATQLAADLQVDEKHPRSICRQKNRGKCPIHYKCRIL
ncbi:zinc finger MYM-type protein 1-like [Oratosquilla oratoria]|uniref:zinc finger MYM-type protein 1-like n=1 Tax=Oratosquilla oratoria TaxID=337810 RepID=UPI003F76F6FD